MNGILRVFAYIFLTCIILVGLSNNIFCMCQIELPDLAFLPPDLAFALQTQSDPSVNLDEINFNTIHDIICGVNFDFKFFKKIVSMYCCSRLAYLSNSKEWMCNEKHKRPFSSKEHKFSKKCKKLMSDKFARESVLHENFYAQKLFIDKTTKLITISDLHADFDALDSILNNMRNIGYIDENFIIKEGCFLVGLGDYVDRKPTSLRTLTLLLIIALKNPGKVIFLRGNHEDVNINLIYGIKIEIMSAFGGEFIEKTCKLLIKLYELMPSVLYVAQSNLLEDINDFLIFSHALLDFKFNPSHFLDFDNSELMKNRGTRFCTIEQNIFGCEDLVDIPLTAYGFVWHDIGLKNSSRVEIDSSSNRYRYKPDFIKYFCKKYSSGTNLISGMVGGHEHYLAKYIHLADKDPSLFTQYDFRGELTPSVAYIKVIDKGDSAEIKSGLIDAKYEAGVCFTNGLESDYLNCFSMVKFVSAPIDCLAYKPTYLVVSRCTAENFGEHVFWNYKVIEC